MFHNNVLRRRNYQRRERLFSYGFSDKRDSEQNGYCLPGESGAWVRVTLNSAVNNVPQK